MEKTTSSVEFLPSLEQWFICFIFTLDPRCFGRSSYLVEILLSKANAGWVVPTTKDPAMVAAALRKSLRCIVESFTANFVGEAGPTRAEEGGQFTKRNAKVAIANLGREEGWLIISEKIFVNGASCRLARSRLEQSLCSSYAKPVNLAIVAYQRRFLLQS